jgi:hypothetical protein
LSRLQHIRISAQYDRQPIDEFVEWYCSELPVWNSDRRSQRRLNEAAKAADASHTDFGRALREQMHWMREQ